MSSAMIGDVLTGAVLVFMIAVTTLLTALYYTENHKNPTADVEMYLSDILASVEAIEQRIDKR